MLHMQLERLSKHIYGYVMGGLVLKKIDALIGGLNPTINVSSCNCIRHTHPSMYHVFLFCVARKLNTNIPYKFLSPPPAFAMLQVFRNAISLSPEPLPSSSSSSSSFSSSCVEDNYTPPGNLTPSSPPDLSSPPAPLSPPPSPHTATPQAETMESAINISKDVVPPTEKLENADLARLLDIIDKLREFGVSEDISLPQVWLTPPMHTFAV